MALLLASLLHILSPSAAEAEVTYYLTGQLHPRLAVTVELNGSEVDTFRSKSGRSKVFLKQLDPELLRPGRNEMVIHWEVLEGDADEEWVPSSGYRVVLKQQRDPRDRKTAVDLVTVGGVEIPLPAAGTTGSDRLHFQTLIAPQAETMERKILRADSRLQMKACTMLRTIAAFPIR